MCSQSRCHEIVNHPSRHWPHRLRTSRLTQLKFNLSLGLHGEDQLWRLNVKIIIRNTRYQVIVATNEQLPAKDFRFYISITCRQVHYSDVWVCVVRRKYCEEETDKKCSPHLQQNISLPFSFPLPVKYCQIIQTGVSKLILSPELGGAAPAKS